MGAIYFGDANEDAISNGTETLRLGETVEGKAGYQHMKELGTKPNVYYLPPTDKSFQYEQGLEKSHRGNRKKLTKEYYHK